MASRFLILGTDFLKLTKLPSLHPRKAWLAHEDDLGHDVVGRDLDFVVAESEPPLIVPRGHPVLDRQMAADGREVPLDPLGADLAVVHDRPAGILLVKFGQS